MYQIAKLFGNAVLLAATISTAVNGFKNTGIWQINPEVFNDSDFQPSKPTDRPSPDVTEDVTNSVTAESLVSENDVLPSCSSNSTNETTAFQNASPKDVMPVPHVAQARAKQNPSRRGKTVILTSSPYRKSLMALNEKTGRFL